MTDPLLSWRIRTVSGEEFVWQGDPTSSAADARFLACMGGTLVSLALVESLTPIDAPWSNTGTEVPYQDRS